MPAGFRDVARIMRARDSAPRLRALVRALLCVRFLTTPCQAPGTTLDRQNLVQCTASADEAPVPARCSDLAEHISRFR